MLKEVYEMALKTNKQLMLLFKLVFVGMLILTGILFASSGKHVYASSCGTDYHGNYTCDDGGYDWIGPDSVMCPQTYYKCRKTRDLVYFYDNPPSHMYVGPSSPGDIVCYPPSRNCPGYCN